MKSCPWTNCCRRPGGEKKAQDDGHSRLSFIAPTAPLKLYPHPSRRALDIAEGRKARVSSLARTDRLEPLAEAQVILAFSRAEAAKRAPGLQHPQLCIDAIQYGVENGGEAGLVKVRDR